MAAVPICFPFAADIDVGGGHRSAMLLIRHLDRRRFQSILVLHGREGPAGRWLASHGADLHQIRLEGYAGGSRHGALHDAAYIVRQTSRLARFLRRQRPGILHANDIWMLGTWALAAKCAGVKLLWHHRSGARYKPIHRVGFALADRMVAVSPFAAGRRADHPKCKIIADPFEAEGGRDRQRCRDDLLGELKLPPETRILGFFANLNRPASERKRPLVFVETVAALRERAPDLPVVGAMYGNVDASFKAQVEEHAAAKGIAERIFLMGFRDPPEPHLLAADAVLTPAVDEGFGRALIEAMLLGTPVIASNCGNHPDLVRDGDTGLLVPADDPGAFADGVLALLRDPERRAAIVKRARADADRRFGAQASADAVMAVYDELLGTPDADVPPGRAPAAAYDRL